MIRIDETKQRWERLKQNAIDLGKAWADSSLERYVEPERAGKAKGELIGLSLRKRKAAFLMVLHPTLPLREIAAVAKTSPGVLKIWRTEDAFKQAEKEALNLFGKWYAKTLDIIINQNAVEMIRKRREGERHSRVDEKDFPGMNSEVVSLLKNQDGLETLTLVGSDDEKELVLQILKSERQTRGDFIDKIISSPPPGKKIRIVEFEDAEEFLNRARIITKDLTSFGVADDLPRKLSMLLPFFNPSTWGPSIKLAKEKINWCVPSYISIPLFAQKAAFVRDNRSLKKWQHQPFMKNVDRIVIENLIELISDPRAREELGDERIKEATDMLKERVFELLK
jgi:hypothetical protein